MNKSQFEKTISRIAETKYQEKKFALLNYIRDYFNKYHPEMNAHDCGNSLSWEIDQMVNKRIEERKAAIVAKIETSEISIIMNSLDSVKFLFEPKPESEGE